MLSQILSRYIAVYNCIEHYPYYCKGVKRDAYKYLSDREAEEAMERSGS